VKSNQIDVIQESVSSLVEYGDVPTAFEIRSIFEMSKTDGDTPDIVLAERGVAAPVLKDYDSIVGDGPATWSTRFDLSTWGIFAARRGGRRVGGAVVAFRSPKISMLEGRDDLAVLWDIRVAPNVRRNGVGAALLRAAELWAAANGAASMKVETQNINVPACRFYARHGYVLRAANRSAYPEFPDEIQLLWYKDLPSTNSPGSSR
jgi:GNAT superfamily N-acetyltransferase